MPAPQGYVALDLVGFTDKGDYAAGTTYAQNDLVHSENRIYLSLQDNNIGQALPVSPATETAFWKLWLSGGGDDLEALTAEDTSNVTGGGAGQVVVAQTLIDAIANKVMNDLVAKSQIINNLLATQAGNVLDATQGKVLKDELDQLYSDLQAAVEDSGWIDFTPSGKFTDYGGSTECRYRKIGKCVHIVGTLTATEVIPAGINLNIFFTLPAGYRPMSEVNAICQGSGSNKWLFTIKANGECFESRYSNVENVEINPGNWLPFSVMFFTA